MHTFENLNIVLMSMQTWMPTQTDADANDWVTLPQPAKIHMLLVHVLIWIAYISTSLQKDMLLVLIWLPW